MISTNWATNGHTGAVEPFVLENPVSNLKREKGKNGFMEEQYKGDVIRVTTEKDNSAFPWKPICTILDGASREVIKQIDWQIGYDTPDQAERAD